ncbi:hypothetical protein OsI_36741 [Oryza sativa Indica Group]|uniref:Uncharacterized protein n=1 Tax=Oryza sativa subsp. indica TaxID=39946 RepID=A2ZG43_ORYSI|nr:hypothetical protein OsI_36741 [Oryza sativa Indica Group]
MEPPLPDPAVVSSHHLARAGLLHRSHHHRNQKGGRDPHPPAEQLVVHVSGPEAGDGASVGLNEEDHSLAGGGVEDLVELLDDEHGLADGLPGLEEHGDLPMDGVGGEEEVALAGKVHLHVLIAEPLEVER